MTSWLLNFPNINLNIAEPIDEFVRYININYGEVFVAGIGQNKMSAPA